MKNILSVFRYERYRTTRNIIRMLSVVMTLLVFFGFAWGMYDIAYGSNDQYEVTLPGEDLPDAYRLAEAERYAERVIVLDDLIFQAELVGAPDSVRTAYEGERALLLFYLETGTLAQDYLEPTDVFQPSNIIRGESFAFMTLLVLRYLLYAYAVFLGASSLAMEYRTGTIRTLVAAPVGRRDILLGKILSMIVETALAVLLTGAIALAISAIYGIGSAPILVRTAHSFISVTPLALLGVRIASIWVGMIFLIALSASLGVLLRSFVAGLLIPAGFYFVAGGIYASILTSDYSIYNTIDPERLASGFPLLSLDFHMQGWNLAFTVAVLLHLGMSAGLLWIAHIAFKQQNV
ncbi:MAG: hypothetical protein A2Y16_05685 [Tenericutes bacterium GWF2_57_13]|nr:MAG: hypothetical protein A2Y16_05685 [Tenericutes bacterium GWF2_57_13]